MEEGFRKAKALRLRFGQSAAAVQPSDGALDDPNR